MRTLCFWVILTVLPYTTYAAPKQPVDHQQAVKSFLSHVFADNNEYVAELSHDEIQYYAEQQTPRATVVACSDSRVQANVFHKSPVNDLFFIRNIGNQIESTQGSVEYGVRHLKTPVLLIIGHSHCGAIKAALGNYSSESAAIQRELNFLHLKKGSDLEVSVVDNVNNQVKYALKEFKNEIAKNKLVVVGAIYDFKNDFGHGPGKLILINVNGETSAKQLKENKFIKGIQNIAIGTD